jgi:hypothetical protein
METERFGITLKPGDSLRGVAAVEGEAAPAPIGPDSSWQGLSFVAVTLVLAIYGCYLALEDWRALTDALSNPASHQVVILALVIHVFSPLLAPLSYAVIYLSARRDARWYFNFAALCFLGILTAIIEVLTHALR